MLSNKSIVRLSIAFGIIFWVLLLLTNLSILFDQKNNASFGIPQFLPHIFLILFIVSVTVYYRYSIGKAESINFIDLLWRVFVTGLLTTIVSLSIKFFFYVFGGSMLTKNILLINFFYLVNLGLILAFLISTFIVWKRLILYQKSKKLLRTWQFFEYFLFLSLGFEFLGYKLFDIPFNTIILLLVGIGLILSVNLKWVAYLNFRQKWKSILFILLVIIYLWYFFMSLVGYSNESLLITDLLNNVFVLAVFAFIFIYSVFSLLVILFNLPTSSVFESKLEEVINFQRLSQTIPTGQKEEQVFEILLDSAVSAVFADAAWLEITDNKAGKQELLVRNLNPDLIEKIKEAAQNSTLKRILNSELERNPTGQKLTATLKKVPFKSILVYPIIVKNEQIGTLALLKEVDDSFNREMIDIINTYVNQASISIENFRLLNEALENERYKEELKIASRVQKSLLPQTLEKNHDYNIVAFSMAADEVGGDYYDTFMINENKVALIIADVSGKGTSAAFHMSQMKGIFHSLAQLDLEPKEFMVQANSALSRCLEKTSFITASYFIIDTKKKIVRFTRAGHCPTLYLDGRTRETSFFKNKGLGLGILRNSSFEDYVQVNEFYYKPDDVFVLYTDGITEATNQSQEEFGYDRLRTSLLKYAGLSPEKIKDGIIDDLYDFCGKRSLDDDYTMLIVKFNQHENVKSVEYVKTKK